MPAHLSDKLPIRMLADQHIDIRPGILVRQQQHVFVPERVDITASQPALMRIDVRPAMTIAVADGSNPKPDHPGDDETQRSDQERMPNLHIWPPCLKQWAAGSEQWVERKKNRYYCSLPAAHCLLFNP